MSAAAVIIIIGARPRTNKQDDAVEITIDSGEPMTAVEKIGYLKAAIHQIEMEE